MHVWTRLQPNYQKQVGDYGLYGAGMMELEDHVGQLLDKLDELGVATNTIVIFTTDNGADRADGKTFKVHLDGYNQLDLLKGNGPGTRGEIFYFDDAGSLNAVRIRDWKIHFTLMTDWIDGGRSKGWPVVINLRRDPFERSQESRMYFRWYAHKLWTFVPVQGYGARFLATFKEFPPRQKSASLSIDRVLDELQRARQQGS